VEDAAAGRLLLELWTAAHTAERVVARELAERRVDDDQLALLLRLSLAEEPPTPTTLAEETGVTVRTLTHALGRLMARGDAERLPNPRDRRSYVVRLTRKGQKRAAAATPALTRAVERVAEHLDGSPDAMEDLVLRLRHAVAKAADEQA
jgi:DNA-binding MarR family transcriptional regulator